LIALLDRKVKQLTDRLDKLMKESVEAASTNTETSKDHLDRMILVVAESEKTNSDLLSVNAELRRMLNELEDKSVQIANLAKEKVLKYVDLNKELKTTIEDLSSRLQVAENCDGESANASGFQSSNSVFTATMSEKDAEIDRLKELLESVNNKPASESTNEMIVNRDESTMTPKDNSDELIEKNTTLEMQVTELQELMRIKDEELGQLNQDIESLKKLLLDLQKGIIDPVPDLIVDSINDSVHYSIIDPIIEPITDSIIDPITDSIIDPITDSIIDPVIDPIIDPVIDPVIDTVIDHEMNKVSESV